MSSHHMESAAATWKGLFDGLVIFLGFGILSAVLFCGFSGQSQVEKAAAGVFSQEDTDRRNQNLAEISEAQGALIDLGKLQKAMAGVVDSAGGKKEAKTELLVPNSPAFLKQLEQQQAEKPEEDSDGGEAAAAPVEENKAPAKGGSDPK